VLKKMSEALPRGVFQKLGLNCGPKLGLQAGLLATALTSLTSSLTSLRTEGGSLRLTLREKQVRETEVELIDAAVFEGVGWSLYAGRQSGTLEAKSSAIIRGLARRNDLNGQECTLLRFEAAKGRWAVELKLMSREGVLVLPHNLEPVSQDATSESPSGLSCLGKFVWDSKARDLREAPFESGADGLACFKIPFEGVEKYAHRCTEIAGRVENHTSAEMHDGFALRRGPRLLRRKQDSRRRLGLNF
jgi:hypothetical protein